MNRKMDKLVYGYIRILQQHLSSVIPESLFDLCMLFYSVKLDQKPGQFIPTNLMNFMSVDKIILQSLQKINENNYMSFLLCLPVFSLQIKRITVLQMFENLFFTEGSPYLPYSTVSSHKTQYTIIANLKYWINHYWFEDFQTQPECIEYIENVFCKRVERHFANYNNDEIKPAITMLNSLRKCIMIAKEEYKQSIIIAEECKMEKIKIVSDETQRKMQLNVISLLKLDAKTFAEQITLYDSNMFKTVRQREFIHRIIRMNVNSIMSNDDKLKVMRLIKIVERFNNTYNWIKFAILTADGIKMRVKIMEYFIDVANYLLQIGNFNSMVSYNCAFKGSSIYRLKTLKAKISEKHKEILNKISNSCSNIVGYGQMPHIRMLQKQFETKIPFISLVVCDFNMLKEQIGFREENDELLINVTRCNQTYKILEECFNGCGGYKFVERKKYQKYIKKVYYSTVIDIDGHSMIRLSKSVSSGDDTPFLVHYV
eukprot:135273_1